MTERADDPGAGDPAVDSLRAEPEPAWADEIRRGRRERAARLRSVFATFDDGEGGEASPFDREVAAGDEEPPDR